ncbi:hypothetical protein C8R47DRAFT_1067524 [Mycena vitilis]|nr:hypothetical protein C8R47DRAFT_1067524 [Mycena vitilis]
MACIFPHNSSAALDVDFRYGATIFAWFPSDNEPAPRTGTAILSQNQSPPKILQRPVGGMIRPKLKTPLHSIPVPCALSVLVVYLAYKFNLRMCNLSQTHQGIRRIPVGTRERAMWPAGISYQWIVKFCLPGMLQVRAIQGQSLLEYFLPVPREIVARAPGSFKFSWFTPRSRHISPKFTLSEREKRNRTPRDSSNVPILWFSLSRSVSPRSKSEIDLTATVPESGSDLDLVRLEGNGWGDVWGDVWGNVGWNTNYMPAGTNHGQAEIADLDDELHELGAPDAQWESDMPGNLPEGEDGQHWGGLEEPYLELAGTGDPEARYYEFDEERWDLQ